MKELGEYIRKNLGENKIITENISFIVKKINNALLRDNSNNFLLELNNKNGCCNIFYKLKETNGENEEVISELFEALKDVRFFNSEINPNSFDEIKNMIEKMSIKEDVNKQRLIYSQSISEMLYDPELCYSNSFIKITDNIQSVLIKNNFIKDSEKIEEIKMMLVDEMTAILLNRFDKTIKEYFVASNNYKENLIKINKNVHSNEKSSSKSILEKFVKNTNNLVGRVFSLQEEVNVNYFNLNTIKLDIKYPVKDMLSSIMLKNQSELFYKNLWQKVTEIDQFNNISSFSFRNYIYNQVCDQADSKNKELIKKMFRKDVEKKVEDFIKVEDLNNFIKNEKLEAGTLYGDNYSLKEITRIGNEHINLLNHKKTTRKKFGF